MCWYDACVFDKSYRNANMNGSIIYHKNINFGGYVGRKPCVVINHAPDNYLKFHIGKF